MLESFIFGLTLGISVGPIALMIINYGVTRWFRSALAAALGAGLADLSFAFVAFGVGASVVPLLQSNECLPKLVSAILLLALGLKMIKESISSPVQALSTDRMHTGREFCSAYIFTIVNPLTIILFVAFAGQLELSGHWSEYVVYPLAIFAGSLPTQMFLAICASAIGPVLQKNPQVLRFVNTVSGAGVAAFGARALVVLT